MYEPPPPYRAVEPPQDQAALLHTTPPAPTSVDTTVVAIPTQDVSRRLVLPTDTPTSTSPNHKYNKNNHHMRQQLGEVMVDVMHNISVEHRQRGRSVLFNNQLGDVTRRTTIVTTV